MFAASLQNSSGSSKFKMSFGNNAITFNDSPDAGAGSTIATDVKLVSFDSKPRVGSAVPGHVRPWVNKKKKILINKNV